MGQVGLLVGVIISIPGLVMVSKAAVAAYWWAVPVAVLAVIAIPPIFSNPSARRKDSDDEVAEALAGAVERLPGFPEFRLSLPEPADTASRSRTSWRRGFLPDIIWLVVGVFGGGLTIVVGGLIGPVFGAVAGAITAILAIRLSAAAFI
jgi:hypothetical protein